jgi:hypothetical protein
VALLTPAREAFHLNRHEKVLVTFRWTGFLILKVCMFWWLDACVFHISVVFS